MLNLQPQGFLGACTPVISPVRVVVVKKADVLASPIPSDLFHYLGKTLGLGKESSLSRCGDNGMLWSLNFLYCRTFYSYCCQRESGPPEREKIHRWER